LIRDIDRVWDRIVGGILPDNTIGWLIQEVMGPFAAISGMLLLLCIIFAFAYRKNKKVVSLVLAPVCALGSVASAVIWYSECIYPQVGIIPVALVIIISLVMMVLCFKTYKAGAEERAAIAEQRRKQAEEERAVKAEERREKAEEYKKQAEEFSKQAGEWSRTMAGELREGVKAGSKKLGAGLAQNYESLKTPGEQKSLFSNPGTQIKRIAERCFIIECIASVFGAFCFAVLADEFTFMTFLITVGILVGGVVSAYLVSLFFYGIGESMEHIAATRENSQATREDVHTLLGSQKDGE